MDTLSDLPPFDPELLTRVLAGHGTSQERLGLERWAAAHEDHARQWTHLQRVWTAAGHHTVDSDAATERLIELVQASVRARRVTGETRRELPRGPQAPVRWTWRARMVAGLGTIAAAVAVVIFAGRGPSATSTDGTRRYATAPGEQATVTLADGSTVRLGSASTVTATIGGANGARTLTVTGEAVVTVAHHANQPFSVIADGTTARVLGTTFLVRRYPDERQTQVVVADGRVAVRGAAFRDDAILSANMLAVVHDSGGIQIVPNTPIDEYTSLASGRLVFRNKPVRDIVREMARAYGVTIRVADSTLADQPINWTLPVTRWSVTEALDVLADVLDARYSKSGDTLQLAPGGKLKRSRRPVTAPFPPSTDTHYGR